MLAAIAETPIVSHAPRLYCVGDDAQSIFMFRGADFETVHSFGRRLPGSTVLTLSTNYRSHQGVLDVANWLLVHESRFIASRYVRFSRACLSTPPAM